MKTVIRKMNNKQKNLLRMEAGGGEIFLIDIESGI